MKTGSLKGSVTKRNGKWRARYWDAQGKQHSRTFTLKGHADTWLQDELAEMHSGKVRLEDTESFSTYADAWLKKLASDPDVRKNTWDAYEYQYRVHIKPTFGDVEFRHLTPEMVRTWHAKLRTKRKHGKEANPPLSRSTCAKIYRLMKRICADAVEDKRLAVNPCRIAKASSEGDYRLSYEEPPDPAQVRKLAAAVPARYRAMVLLAGFGGLRWGELAGLQRRHINVTAGTVRVEQQIVKADSSRLELGQPKTDAGRRTVYLHAEVVAALKDHLAAHVGTGASAYVFTSPSGEMMRNSNFRRRIWIPATEACNVPGLRFHDLRHAAATLAAMTGASTKDLMARMGHASQAAAIRYQHATQAQQQEIAKRLEAMLTEAETEAKPAANVVPLRRRAKGAS